MGRGGAGIRAEKNLHKIWASAGAMIKRLFAFCLHFKQGLPQAHNHKNGHSTRAIKHCTCTNGKLCTVISFFILFYFFLLAKVPPLRHAYVGTHIHVQMKKTGIMQKCTWGWKEGWGKKCEIARHDFLYVCLMG